MKSDLLYKVVFSHKNSPESFAVLKTYYRANTVKLCEWMCMRLRILFPLFQWNTHTGFECFQQLALYLLNYTCIASAHWLSVLAGSTVSAKGKRNTVFTSKNFSSALFRINFSFLLFFFHFKYTTPLAVLC